MNLPVLWLEVALLADPSAHWAYRPLTKPELPAVRDASWCRNEIDRFVLARLEAEGLRPSPPAAPEVLLRRLSLDLIGLPPTLQEQDAFHADVAARGLDAAYESVVDRLLASPRYGERMAVPWLDLARYADTNGYEKDLPRSLWPWRDYVIRSFNSDLPFAQFTIEQLAGDLLPEPSLSQRVATGFHRNTLLNDEGGIDREEFRVAAIVDRVNTTATVWLGSTIQCAQCHDHKHDPFTQRDYYALYAFFDQTADNGAGNGPEIAVPTDEQIAAREKLRAERESVAAGLAISSEGPQAGALRDSIRAALATPRPNDAILEHSHAELAGNSGIELGDVAVLERDQAFSYGAIVKPENSGAVLSRIDDTHDYRGYDLFYNEGRFEVHLVHRFPDDAIKVETVATFPKSVRRHVFVTYDGSSKAAGIRIYVDGESAELRTIHDSLASTLRTAVSFEIGSRHASGPLKGEIDRLEIFLRALSDAEVKRLASERLAPLVGENPATLDELRAAYASFDPAGRELSAKVAALDKQIEELPIATSMVLETVKEPRTTRLMKRGNFRTPGEVVTPDTPAILPPFDPAAPRNRLGLAKWLVDRRNPLFARVAVNRAFAQFFGEGLVATGEDFGTKGDLPSHPELLDWLACDFHDHDTRLKELNRRIVSSATYRQSNRVTPELIERDPNNRSLARASRFRLDFEFLRDQALAIGGMLDARIGGPSVMPPQPPGIWNDSFAAFDTPQYTWKDAEGPDRNRRGLYTYLRRSALYPSALTFDTPRRDVCVIERSRTNTALQALDVWNDPVFVEAAGGLARRLLACAPETRIQTASRIVLARLPTPTEVSTIEHLLARARIRFIADPSAAQDLVSAARAGEGDAIELATLITLSSALLDLDETLTRG